MGVSVERARGQLADLVGRAAYGADFGDAVYEAAHGVVPFDGWCLLGMDPRSGLRTFQFSRHGTESAVEMALNEAVQADVNKFADLCQSPVPAGCLDSNHPLADTSVRFNEILRPQGFGSEMRLVLRESGRLWGALVLFRDQKRRSFTAGDIDLMLRLAPPLASAVRRYPMRPFAKAPTGLPQGVVLMSPDNKLLAVSSEAQAWLDDLIPGGGDETAHSDVTRVLFDAAHAVRACSGQTPEAAMAPIRTVSGRWLLVQGDRLPYGEADVAVLLQTATVRQLLTSVIDIQGLNRREGHVLEGIAGGLPAKHIARELRLSPHTVNGYAKSIYRKTGASGREELLGQLT